MRRRESRIGGRKPARVIAGAALAGALLAGGAAAAQEAGIEDFAQWREGVRSEALDLGISATIFDMAFAGIEPIPRIIELDRTQPEVTITFAQYLERVVPESRVAMGREAARRSQRAAGADRPQVRCPAALHRRPLGHRDELRPLSRRVSRNRRARDARP